MCRILSYLGTPIVPYDLFYQPDSAFIKQSYDPKHMAGMLNLAGFGFVAWDEQSRFPNQPYVYRTTKLPFYDRNLRAISKKIAPKAMIAHVRGTPHTHDHVIIEENLHPFQFKASTVALAHNGFLHQFDEAKAALQKLIHPCYFDLIRGNTDSEWIYALLLSQLPFNETEISDDILAQGVYQTLEKICDVRKKLNHTVTSGVNLCVSNGQTLIATRYVFNYGNLRFHALYNFDKTYNSLWYTFGKEYGIYQEDFKMTGLTPIRNILIASEPLTTNTSTWMEVPEYSLVIAKFNAKDNIDFHLYDINI